MRITFVLPNINLSGGARVVAAYAKRLRSRGHDIAVVASPPRPPSTRERILSLLKRRPVPNQPTLDRSYFESIPVDVVDRYRPIRDGDVPDADVVVATWWETAESVARFSSQKGAKAYLIQGDERVIYPQADVARRERVRATWKLPMHKITVARWLVDQFRAESGDEVVSYVPNSVDTTQFFAAPRGKQVRLTVGLTYARAHFKGTDIALEAIRLARESAENLAVLAFGAHRPEPTMSLPAETTFAWRPSQSELRTIYGNCDAWLFTSRREGFGLPILEAMACRTPVIGTPTGAAPDLIAKGGGWLVGAEDPAAVAQAILRVGKMSEGEWRGVSEAALATATGYTWEDATVRLEQALELAIQRARQGKIASGATER